MKIDITERDTVQTLVDNRSMVEDENKNKIK
jgi:hypothetical protein